MEKTKVNTPQGVVDANELDFKIKNEPWTIIEVEDGTTLRIRINIGKIYRLEVYDQMSGEPGYQLASKMDVRTSVPTKLKKFLSPNKASSDDVNVR